MTFLVKKLTSLLLFLLILQLGKAQKHEWVRGIFAVDTTSGSWAFAEPHNLDVDSRGNTISSGHYLNKFDFDPGPQTYLDSSGIFIDSYVNKLDSNGEFIFNHSLKGNNSDYAFESDIDYNDNIIITGHFYDTLFIGNTDTLLSDSNFTANIFIIKLDSDGNYIWGKSIGGKGNDGGREVVIDKKNNIYFQAYVEDTVELDPGGSEDYLIEGNGFTHFILKLDSNGVFQWVNTFQQELCNIGINQFNQLFLVGKIDDTTSFNLSQNGSTTIYPSDNSNFFYCLINEEGRINWVKSFHSNSAIQGSTFEDFPSDQNGNFYHFGTFSGNLYENDNPQKIYLSSSLADGFIHKVDTNGNTVWLNTIHSQNRLQTSSIASDSYSNIFMTIDYSSGKTTIKSNNPNNEYSYNASIFHNHLIKIDSTGTLLWAKALKSEYSLSTHAMDWFNGSINITGNFINNPYWDSLLNKPMNPGGGLNTFILKTKDCQPSLAYDTLVLCEGDSSFIPNIQTIHSGTYRNLISTSQNCDSLIQTYVQVFPSYYDTTYYRNCSGEPLEYNGKVFESDTSFTTYYQTDIGCDSNFIDLIRISTSHLDSQYVTICSGESITIGSNTYDSSGIYIDSLKTIIGCDSIIYTELNIAPLDTINQEVNLCSQDTLYVGSNAYFETGNYIDTLKNQFECDSIVITTLNVFDTSRLIQNIKICHKDTFSVGTSNYTQSGTYQNRLTNSNGCDSIITTILTVRSTKKTNQTFTLCRNSTIIVDGITYNETGKFKRTLSDQFGCDSLVTTTIRKANLNIDSPRENQLEVDEYSSNYQWINCDLMTLIESETLKTISYTQTGNYAVIIENEFCTDTSDCFIAKFEKDYVFKLYPNPSTQICFVEIPTSGSIDIYDMRGSKAFSAEFTEAGKYKLEIPHLTAGIYYVEYNGLEGKKMTNLAITK